MDLTTLLEERTGCVLKDIGDPSLLEIKGITHDYMEVEPGFLYVCLENEEYQEPHIQGCGLDYVNEAIHKGAVCILLKQDLPDLNHPRIICNEPNELTALMAARLNGNPLDEMTVVGVTGTNGKTSCTFILQSIFEACGKTPAVAGTLGFLSSVYSRPTCMYTTPLAADLHQQARRLKDRGGDALLLESTSHGIALAREWAVDYDAVVFTNFSQDHLDFHPDMEHYKQTKLSLFRRLKHQQKKTPLAVVNLDDPSSRDFLEAASGARILTCSLEEPAHYTACNLEMEPHQTRFEIRVKDGGTLLATVALPGYFNVYNALFCFAVAHGLGLPLDGILCGLASVRPIPGRFEMVENDGGRTVVVDFAHTPDALEKVLESARALQPGKIITVFGCGGDRDPGKRPEMGRIAAGLSDLVVVTSDNPRTEDPIHIIEQILTGVPRELEPRVMVEPDRKAAVRKALELARPGDVTLIAGKGHEPYQIIGHDRIPYNDHQEVKAFFQLASMGQTLL